MNNIQIQIPGELGIVYTDDDVILKPQPDLSAQIQQILDWVLQENISGINIPYLCDILPFIPRNKLSGSLVAGKYISKYDSSKDGCIQVRISPDDMTAYLSILDFPESKPITVFDCYFNLLKSGVKRGFKSENLLELIAEQHLGTEVIAASGKPAEKGEDGEILLHEKIAELRKSPHFVFEDIVTVRQDEIIAQQLPATPGAAGFTVKGDVLESPVHTPDFPPGENTYVSEGGLTLFSAIDGHLLWNGSRLSVEDVLRISGNVDFITSNIDYDGPIEINGDVRSGLKVKATGDIEIHGCIEGASIHSMQGRIKVHSGINGFEKSEIRAAKDIIADYIQDAKIIAGDAINVTRYVSRSTLEAGGTIRVVGKGGLVRGGSLWSQKSIEINVAGSSTCIPTRIMVRYHANPDQQQELEQLQKQTAEIEEQQQRIRRRLDYLGLLEQRQSNLSAKHQNEAHLLSEGLIANSKQIMELEDRINTSSAIPTLTMDEKVTLVTVHHKIYPGAKFIIGNQELLIKEEINGGEIQLLQGRIFLKPRQNKALIDRSILTEIQTID